MADEQKRLTGSDISDCFVAFYRYDQNNENFYYPRPILPGFRSVLGDEEALKQKNRVAWQEAQSKYAIVMQWQEIFDRYDRKESYTPEQNDLIDKEIELASTRKAKKIYAKLKLQVPEVDFDLEKDIHLLNNKELEGFDPFGNVRAPVSKSSYKFIGNRLIIVHAAIDTTRGETPDKSAGLILNELQRQGVVNGSVQITHLIPEGGEGRMDGLFGVKHIRLRVAHGNPIDMARSQLIDPRDVHQGTFDTVNCGRYVATMIGQAVGLHKAGLPINAEALKASPIVANADKFISDQALQEATIFASEHPIDIRAQQDEVARIIAQLEQLNETYKQRVALGLRYKHWWGGFFGGFEASQKQTVTQEILETGCLDLKGLAKDIAEQGELGKLFQQLKAASAKTAAPNEDVDIDSDSQDAPAKEDFFDESEDKSLSI